MIGYRLNAAERTSAKRTLIFGVPVIAFLALQVAKMAGGIAAIGFVAIMLMLLIAIGMQVRVSRLHDEMTNG
ncbi:hypothetical protein EAH87_02290 [Sphingomonas koreensis]|nr:hypothetical protein EAH87_02290 [Sphingomonas koreensis]